MLFSFIIYVIYSANQLLREKKNIKKTLYYAKRDINVIAAALFLMIILKNYLLLFINTDVYISILIGLTAAIIFAIVYILLKNC